MVFFWEVVTRTLDVSLLRHWYRLVVQGHGYSHVGIVLVGLFRWVCAVKKSGFFLLWSGKIIMLCIFHTIFVFGSMNVIESGVCAHGEEVETCVNFL